MEKRPRTMLAYVRSWLWGVSGSQKGVVSVSSSHLAHAAGGSLSAHIVVWLVVLLVAA